MCKESPCGAFFSGCGATCMYPNVVNKPCLGHTQAAHALLFGGKTMNATDAAIAPKLYHITVSIYDFMAVGHC